MDASILDIIPIHRQLRKRVAEMEKMIEEEFGLKVSLQVRAMQHEYEMDVIVRLVSDILMIPINRIIGERKISESATDARHIAIYLIVKYLPKMPRADIGTFFSRDGSLIQRNIQKINDLLAAGDKKIVDKLGRCETALLSKISKNENENLHQAE